MQNSDVITQKSKTNTASRIIRLTQDKLVMTLPFLNRAILRLPYEAPNEDDEEAQLIDGIATDGRFLIATPDYIINTFKSSDKTLLRICLHSVFHCLFCHPFQYEKMHTDLWDVACDMAVENTIFELGKNAIALDTDVRERHFIYELKKDVPTFTAENIYNYFYRHGKERSVFLENAKLFRKDDHSMWLSSDKFAGKEILGNNETFDTAAGETMEQWKNTARNIQLDSEAFTRFQEEMPGSAIDSIKEVFREKRSYRDFLLKFVQHQEELRLDPDEFDYVYYTYGMNLYGNLPLIEPLEYRDTDKIKSIVIAIDTSGSCQGKIVRAFLNKTATILKDSGLFFDEMNVFIIQCDSKITDITRITSQDDFDRYLIDLKVKGFGGTDFRPVFEYADRLVEEKRVSDFKGVIYFTDGLGTFPKVASQYKTAFVVIEDPKEKCHIPAWAIRQDATLEEMEK